MRLRALLFATVALGATGAGAWQLGLRATDYVERRAEAQVVATLAEAGQDWASVATDGMQVILSGTAPDEATRFRAVEVVRRTVDPARVVDRTEVAAPDPLAPPPFALELLRNGAEISLIGLVPAEDARHIATAQAIRAALAQDGLGTDVTDMLETADDPEPPGWADALGYGLKVLSTLPRAKISVAPGRINVIAVADSPAAREALERRLVAGLPKTVSLSLDISAPRQVIAPFRLSYVLDAKGGGRFDACSAEDDAAVAAIMEAAAEAGLAGGAHCEVGLGAPGPDWTEAATTGIAALGKLGAGRFSLTDTRAVLSSGQDVAPEALHEAAEALRGALPPSYGLTAKAPPRMEVDADGAEVYAPRFTATLGKDGGLKLAGAVRDETQRQAIVSYAAARFGHDSVTDTTVLDQDLPEGWPGRVIAGIDALGEIHAGELTVSAGDVALEGWDTSEDAEARLRAELGERVGRARVDVRYDAAAAEEEARAEARAAMSQPEICAEEIDAILESGSINFKAGSAEITPESQGIIAAIADVLRTCPGAQFEVAGHTDSQGREDVNDRLSAERAEAVREVLEDQDLPLVSFRARGYGAGRPVADNDTEEGRRRNRRIELVPFSEADAAAEEEGEGVTLAPDGTVQLSPEACSEAINEVLAGEGIVFDVGASLVSTESRDVIADIADVLKDCAPVSFEIGGYTDDRGSESSNQRISASRAEAVLYALQAEKLPDTVTLTSHGYGPANPIADNSTSEGRAANRRIEMKLLGVEEPEAAAEDAASDETAAPDDTAADEAGSGDEAFEATGSGDGAVEETGSGDEGSGDEGSGDEAPAGEAVPSDDLPAETAGSGDAAATAEDGAAAAATDDGAAAGEAEGSDGRQ
ncbi:MAG: OmpA family protein [Rhodobacteraceae bacterium]|nr:OmpA family protein [Paracoccaceae bacterium]